VSDAAANADNPLTAALLLLTMIAMAVCRFWCPFVANVSYTDQRAPAANDFVGLNYYSHYYVVSAVCSSFPVQNAITPHYKFTHWKEVLLCRIT
jgi:hypothetical protein